eukprot:11758931-Karenia_brevis.AAC.1
MSNAFSLLRSVWNSKARSCGSLCQGVSRSQSQCHRVCLTLLCGSPRAQPAARPLRARPAACPRFS